MTRQVSTARLAATALTFGTGAAFVATAVLLPRQWGRMPAWWHLTLLLVLSGCLVSFARATLGRSSPVTAARVTVVTVAVGAGSLPLVTSGPYTQQEAPWVTVFMPASMVACGLTFRQWPAGLAVGVGMLLIDTAVRTTDVFATTWPDVLAQGVYDLTTLLVAVSILLALTYAERELDHQAAVAADSYLKARTVDELSRHQAQWDALVHDEVLSTLESAARGAPAAEVRTEARAAADYLRDGPLAPGTTSADLRKALLEAVLETNPAATTRFAPPASDACEVPEQVARALLTAAVEAMRNAAVHAYPRSATGPVLVELQHTSTGVRVVVGDRGRGFRRDWVPATSFGITISIEDRMAGVGGRGVVTSAPGRGTRVELTWSPPRSSQ